ncbi:hypothetical protein ACFLRX_00650 [Acidobacteriota bacterium]
MVQTLWLAIIKPFMPTFNEFLNHSISTLEGYPDVFISMMSDPYISRYIFLFKLPYLFFEFGILYLIFKFFNKNSLFPKLWMISIPMIYSVYLFGRFETIPLFFLILTLYFFLNGKNIFGYVAFAFLLASRSFFLLLIPFFFIILIKRKSKLNYIAWPAGMILVYYFREVIFELVQSEFGLYLRTFLHVKIKIPIFLIIYFLLLYKIIKEKDGDFVVFIKYSSLCIIFYMALCFWHPQYFTWAVPFLIYYSLNSPKRIRILTLISIFYIVFLFYWGGDTTFMLFSPIDYDFFQSISNFVFEQTGNLLLYIAYFSRVSIFLLLSYFLFDLWKSPNTNHLYHR